MCKINRTYGVELEGYVNDDLEGRVREGWEFVEDGSLGSGEYMDCDYCEGSGYERMDCEECGGSGYQSCNECGGSKELECTYCDGSGQDDEGEECCECDGTGTFECCDCDGDGEIRCEHCDGDGYYNTECPDCYGSGSNGETCGIECVSPILNHGDYDSIDRIFNYIDGYSWHTDSSCGTHVHVGGKDLDVKALRNLALLSNVFEPIIYGIVSGNRHGNNYCRTSNTWFINRLLDMGDNIELWQLCNTYYDTDRVTDDEGCEDKYEFDKYEDERYYGLNLHSWFYRKTIEFRYFEGTESRTDVKTWVDLCVKLVEFAKHTTLEQITVIAKDFYKVDNLSENCKMLQELLGLEYNIRPRNNYTYDRCRRNIVDRFRYVASAEELAS